MQTVDSTRPEGVKITTAAMAAFLVAQFVLALYSMHRVSAIIAERQGGFHIPAVFSGGIGIFSTVIAAVFVVLYWQGNNVGRWAVLIDSGLVLLNAISSIFTLVFMRHIQTGLGLGPVLYIGTAINLLKACLAVYFFWYLNQPEVKAWFVRSAPGAGGYPPQGYATPYAQQPPSPYATAEPVPQQPIDPPPPGFTV